MLAGFNTNIRHRGVLFHVQTEDSGRQNPHVITHLYYRGTILASERSEYADLLDATDLEGALKARMERQHRAMLMRLRRGEFDAVIDERLGEASGAGGDATGSTTQPDPPNLPTDTAAAEAPRAERPTPHPFGRSVVSEKPLDEVVLEYLVDHARKRKRGPK